MEQNVLHKSEFIVKNNTKVFKKCHIKSEQ